MAQRSYFLLLLLLLFLLLLLLKRQESTFVVLNTNCSSRFKALCFKKIYVFLSKHHQLLQCVTLHSTQNILLKEFVNDCSHSFVIGRVLSERARLHETHAIFIGRLLRQYAIFFFISLLHICDLHALTYVYVRLLDLPTPSLLAPLRYSTEEVRGRVWFLSFNKKKRLRGKLETEDK